LVLWEVEGSGVNLCQTILNTHSDDKKNFLNFEKIRVRVQLLPGVPGDELRNLNVHEHDMDNPAAGANAYNNAGRRLKME